MANHQSLPQHGKPSPTLSLMLKEFTEKNLRRLWGGFGVPIGWLAVGFEVALVWLCTPESMPSICLLYGFGVALGGFVRPAVCLRLPHFPRWPKPGKAAFCRFTVCLACITRPGGDWGHPRECQSHPRRVSGGSPMTLPGCYNRFGLAAR